MVGISKFHWLIVQFKFKACPCLCTPMSNHEQEQPPSYEYLTPSKGIQQHAHLSSESYQSDHILSRNRNNINRLDDLRQQDNTPLQSRVEPVSPAANHRNTKRINNFELGPEIGKGTFSKVHIAKHLLTRQQVAIKVIEKSKIAEDEADRVRLEREMKILRKVRHPNISQLYEIIETNKYYYLVMEYASRGELFDHIIAQQKLTEFEASKFLMQIIDAIEYLHKLGVSHRDLKPENLLLDHKFNIKLIDFGLSNISKAGHSLTTACGSPCYACPQMLSGKPYDGLQADIWSTGVILYAMCFGYLPFDNPSTTELYKSIRQATYQIPSEASNTLSDILGCILEADPEKRATIQEIRMHPFCKFALPSFNECMMYGKNISQSRRSQGGSCSYGSPSKRTHNTYGIIPTLSEIPFEQDIEEEMRREIPHFCNSNASMKHLREQVINNRHTEATCIYYLLLSRRLRENNQTLNSYYISKYNTINRYFIIGRVKENYDRKLMEKLQNRKKVKYGTQQGDQNYVSGRQTERKGGGFVPHNTRENLITKDADRHLTETKKKKSPVKHKKGNHKALNPFMRSDVKKTQRLSKSKRSQESNSHNKYSFSEKKRSRTLTVSRTTTFTKNIKILSGASSASNKKRNLSSKKAKHHQPVQLQFD